MRLPRGMECYCEGHCPDQAGNGTCLAQPGGACFAAVEEVLDADSGLALLEISYGCLPPDGAGLMQCKGSLVPHLNRKSIECCDEGRLCNRRLEPRVADAADEGAGVGGAADGGSALPAAAVCLAALFCMAAALLLCRRRRRGAKRPPSPPAACDPSSGSGSGLPLLVQRTVARQIRMISSVGKGRYGEVWVARFRGERVAVKVFFTTEEASWFRETEIYQTVLMRHEDILGFVAADIEGTGARTRMLLVTDYHERGSLHDYLKTAVLDRAALAALARSFAGGVAHLHVDAAGAKGKAAIAHRDIKSRNVLVTADGRCVVADFGSAVRYAAERDEVDGASDARVGTRRYMAPEVLDDSLDRSDFEAYKMADMYSFGLVLWEMCRRCATGDRLQFVEEYALPYHDRVPHDPSLEEMRAAVCVERVRPQIPPRWESDELLSTLARVVRECWHPNPPARLTALRVKKTLIKFDPDASVKLV